MEHHSSYSAPRSSRGSEHTRPAASRPSQRRSRSPKKGSSFGHILLCYILPFLAVNLAIFFIVTATPKIEMTISDTTDYKTLDVSFKVHSLLPLKKMTTTLESHPIEFQKEKGVYHAVLTNNGTLEVYVLSLNGMQAQDIEHIAGETRWRKQTLLFSATLEGDAIQDFAERLLEDPVEVSANPSTRERKKIHQWYYRADDLEHKTALLVHLLKQPEATRSIVFVRKRERVHELANWLREAGINNCYLEGEMVQGKRNEAIKRLTEGRVNVLVATDVAARGIDIPDVSHVFNFDMPRSGDTYLHRIGRTARAGRKGTAISLVEAHDHLLLGKVGRYIEEPIKARVIDELRPKTRAPSEKQTGKPSKKVLAKRAEKKKAKEKEKPRVKKRHRDTKNIGKRRKPSAEKTAEK